MQKVTMVSRQWPVVRKRFEEIDCALQYIKDHIHEGPLKVWRAEWEHDMTLDGCEVNPDGKDEDGQIIAHFDERLSLEIGDTCWGEDYDGQKVHLRFDEHLDNYDRPWARFTVLSTCPDEEYLKKAELHWKDMSPEEKAKIYRNRE